MELTYTAYLKDSPKDSSHSLKDINRLQTAIMIFVAVWARTEKTVIPQKEIIIAMRKSGIQSYTTVNAISALLKKGYIRKSVGSSTKSTSYVQLRSV